MDDIEEIESLMNFSDFNMTDSVSASTYGEKRYLFYMRIVLFGIIGLVGNGTLVVILRRIRKISAQNTFILNLAVADLIVLLFHLPFTGRKDNYPYGEIICWTSEILYEISAGVSAFTLIAMSAFCFYDGQSTTGTLRSGRSKRNVVVAIWGIAIAFAFPTMLFTHLVDTYGPNHENVKMCLTINGDSQSVIAIELTEFYVIPLLAFGVFLIIACLTRKDVASREQKEFSKVILALYGIYVLCFSPYYLVVSCFVSFEEEYLIANSTELWWIMENIGYWLLLMYRCLNPVVLYCVSGTFRQLFNRHLICWCTKGNREPVADLELSAQDSASGALE